MFFLFFFFVLTVSHSHGSKGFFEEDLEASKKIPLISGVLEHKKDILEGKKAVVTLCTVPFQSKLFSVDHIALIFEMKLPSRDGIDLFSVCKSDYVMIFV